MHSRWIKDGNFANETIELPAEIVGDWVLQPGRGEAVPSTTETPEVIKEKKVLLHESQEFFSGQNKAKINQPALKKEKKRNMNMDHREGIDKL